MDFDGFDWDDGNWPKCGKHGVSKEEIEEVLSAADTRTFPDAPHSVMESRQIAVGHSLLTRRAVAIFFTQRQRGEKLLLRPFSARYMHPKEVGKYEQTRPR
jgi:uncharacterized DUF497 family protein